MPFFLLLLLLFSPPAISSSSLLSLDYYDSSCPRLHDILSDVLISKQSSNPTTAPGILRLFFHDCFVSGCDASLLISPSPSLPSERSSDINLSLPGDAFDAILRAKSSLELHCPSTVSCSDILSLSARFLLSLLGAPFFPLPLGRKDSLSSSPLLVPSNLPLPNSSIPHIISLFLSKSFTIPDFVALSGAHTVGFSHCSQFAHRIFNFNNAGPFSFDPTLNPRFARGLQNACRDYLRDPNIATFNDVITPGKFDNMYFKNLLRGLGLLDSDQKLVEDPRTLFYVKLYAMNQTAFFRDFAIAMQKLSVLGVKTGTDGEIRRRCDMFND